MQHLLCFEDEIRRHPFEPLLGTAYKNIELHITQIFYIISKLLIHVSVFERSTRSTFPLWYSSISFSKWIEILFLKEDQIKKVDYKKMNPVDTNN